MLVRRTVVAACVLALAAVAGCSSDTSSDEGPRSGASTNTATDTASDAATDTAPEPATAAPTGYPTYVALGDSYTAAPGVPVTEQQSGCSRSSSNYPQVVAERLEAQLSDVSCSGADTGSLITGQPTAAGTQPPQLDALSADTTLVTLGMGGNDEALFTTMAVTCMLAAGGDRTGSPCADANGEKVRNTIRATGDRIAAALTKIEQRAPQAEVLVIGYPQIVPATGTCPQLPLAEGDYAFARQLIEGLDGALETAAEARGATYVDVLDASQGHSVCAGADAWVNGLQSDPQRAVALHPFAEEQEAVASLIVEQLEG